MLRISTVVIPVALRYLGSLSRRPPAPGFGLLERVCRANERGVPTREACEVWTYAACSPPDHRLASFDTMIFHDHVLEQGVVGVRPSRREASAGDAVMAFTRPGGRFRAAVRRASRAAA